jgi:hypothetical protein
MTKARKIRWQTTMGKGMTVVRDAKGSGVALIAARVEDGGSRQRRQRQTTMVVDDDGGGWRRLTRLGSGLWGRTRAGGKRWGRQLPCLQITSHCPSPARLASSPAFPSHCVVCCLLLLASRCPLSPPPVIQYPLAHPNNCSI